MRTFRHFVTTLVLLISFRGMAATAEPSIINQFFNNYSLLTQGWSAFVTGQTRVLDQNLITIVRDHRGTTLYRGASGYFKSIQEWSGAFKTDTDFHTQYMGESEGRYHVAIHGTILFTINGITHRIPDTQHCWEEVFSLDRLGRISAVEVNMNLNCRR